MNHNERDKDIVDNITVQESRSQGETPLPPWLFRHTELIQAISSADCIDKKKLINILNYFHFNGDPVYVLLKHPQYSNEILIKVRHDPCLGDRLTVHWDQTYSEYKLERYRFQYVVIPHDHSVILVPSQLPASEQGKITLQLPETGLVISERQLPRFRCREVRAELWQSGFQAAGELIDFSSRAFRIYVADPAPSASFFWFNTETPVTLRLCTGENVLYICDCMCMFQHEFDCGRQIVLAPLHDTARRLIAKGFRNPRKQSSAPLYAAFDHPFTKKTVQREIFDISSSGFSICDSEEEAALLPGLIIPDMVISYAGILKLHCKAQIIYRKEDPAVRFGVAILDMDIREFNTLNQLVNNLCGTSLNMSNDVDPDQLWEFFFESDFLYPAKYEHIHTFREDFKQTYRQLYKDTSEIAKHFTYQKDGRIYSHISSLRAYDRAWLVHHHAARALNGKHTGLLVLKQMILYLYSLRLLPAAKMDYCICFFRPSNRFTERIYAGFAKHRSDPTVCSLDLFAFLTCAKEDLSVDLPEGWSLRETHTSDLWELEQYYKHCSGGLLLDMLDIKRQGKQTIEQAYSRLGFHRKWSAFSLYFKDNLKVIILAEESNIAINLSDLLNGFKVFILDLKTPLGAIYGALGRLLKNYPVESCPLLFYPADYVKHKGLNSEKHYFIWILNTQYAHEFIEYLMRRFRMRFD